MSSRGPANSRCSKSTKASKLKGESVHQDLHPGWYVGGLGQPAKSVVQAIFSPRQLQGGLGREDCTGGSGTSGGGVADRQGPGWVGSAGSNKASRVSRVWVGRQSR